MNINANINTRININTNTRARGLTARRPEQTHTSCYSALVGGGRRAFGPHLAAAEVSDTLSAEHVGRRGCSK